MTLRSFVIIALLALTLVAVSCATLPLSKTASPSTTNGITSTDTSLNSFSNSSYGYTFSYPKAWTIFQPSASNSDYLSKKLVRIISPQNPREQDIVGLTQYYIVVSDIAALPRGYGGSEISLKEQLEDNSKTIPGVITRLQSKDNSERFIVSNIFNKPDAIDAFIFAPHSAFQVSLGRGFKNSPTSDDMAAFMTTAQSLRELEPD